MLGKRPSPPSFAMTVAALVRLAAEEGRRDRVLRIRVRLSVRDELFRTGEGLREDVLDVGVAKVGVLAKATERGGYRLLRRKVRYDGRSARARSVYTRTTRKIRMVNANVVVIPAKTARGIVKRKRNGTMTT